MFNLLRMLIAEWFLGKAVDLAPKTDEGRMLVAAIGVYFWLVPKKQLKPSRDGKEQS